VPRKTSAELVQEARSEIDAARARLTDGDLKGAADAARQAFKVARSQRSHQLISEAWVSLLETLAADPENDLTTEYREHVEGAFYWAETMPEEIQVWFLIALEPHLQALGFRRLVERSDAIRARATKWLERSLNVSTRLQAFQLSDLEAGRKIDRRCLAAAWRQAGRPDRADFVAALADEVRNR
jgi:hypothetical protein